MARVRVTVLQENQTGRNKRFRDNYTKETMTDKQFVKKIENGDYEGKFHIRNINGEKTPVSNPDSTRNNNLG